MVCIFWGLWLLPFGFLVVKSGFIPRILGVMLIVACFGYLAGCFTFLLFPHLGKTVFSFATIPSAIAEISIILWLLIKGAREPRPARVNA